MRSFLLPLLCLAFVVAGCDSVPTRVRERFEAPQPQVRTYAADQRAVFDAAVVALKTIDFEISRSRPNQGILAAHSRIQASDAFSGEARQYTFDLTVALNDAGQVDLSALLRQQDESAAFAGATNIALRQHGLYDAFFAALEIELRKTGAIPAAK